MQFKYRTVSSVPLPPAEERVAILHDMKARGIEPSPDELLREGECEDHPLHKYLFNPEVDWEHVGRREYCRRFIHKTHEAVRVAGRVYQARTAEYLGKRRYGFTQDIVENPKDAARLLEQCAIHLRESQRKVELASKIVQSLD